MARDRNSSISRSRSGSTTLSIVPSESPSKRGSLSILRKTSGSARSLPSKIFHSIKKSKFAQGMKFGGIKGTKYGGGIGGTSLSHVGVGVGTVLSTLPHTIDEAGPLLTEIKKPFRSPKQREKLEKKVQELEKKIEDLNNQISHSSNDDSSYLDTVDTKEQLKQASAELAQLEQRLAKRQIFPKTHESDDAVTRSFKSHQRFARAGLLLGTAPGLIVGGAVGGLAGGTLGAAIGGLHTVGRSLKRGYDAAGEAYEERGDKLADKEQEYDKEQGIRKAERGDTRTDNEWEYTNHNLGKQKLETFYETAQALMNGSEITESMKSNISKGMWYLISENNIPIETAIEKFLSDEDYPYNPHDPLSTSAGYVINFFDRLSQESDLDLKEESIKKANKFLQHIQFLQKKTLEPLWKQAETKRNKTKKGGRLKRALNKLRKQPKRIGAKRFHKLRQVASAVKAFVPGMLPGSKPERVEMEEVENTYSVHENIPNDEELFSIMNVMFNKRKDKGLPNINFGPRSEDNFRELLYKYENANGEWVLKKRYEHATSNKGITKIDEETIWKWMNGPNEVTVDIDGQLKYFLIAEDVDAKIASPDYLANLETIHQHFIYDHDKKTWDPRPTSKAINSYPNDSTSGYPGYAIMSDCIGYDGLIELNSAGRIVPLGYHKSSV